MSESASPSISSARPVPAPGADSRRSCRGRLQTCVFDRQVPELLDDFPMISGSASRCRSSSKRCSAFSSFWRIDAFIFSYSLTAMQSSPPHRLLSCTLSAGACAGQCCCQRITLAASARRMTSEDSNALIMTAEIALQRDDCGRASAELYDGRAAAHGCQAGAACGRRGARLRAVPGGGAGGGALAAAEPSRSGAAARRDACGAGALPDRRCAQRLRGLARTRRLRRRERAQRRRQPRSARRHASPAAAQVAQEAACRRRWRCCGRAAAPLQSWPRRSWHWPIWRSMAGITARRCSMRQRALERRRGARRAQLRAGTRACRPGRGRSGGGRGRGGARRRRRSRVLLTADVLILLGREREARMAWRRCAQTPACASQAERRLGLLAFDRGDYDEAQARFPDAAEGSGVLRGRRVLPVGDRRAARRRRQTALRGYQLLGGTALEAAARRRAATMLYKEGQRDEALQLLQAERRRNRRRRGSRPRSRRRSCCPTAARPIRRWRASMMRWRAFRVTRICSTRRRSCWRRPGRTDAAIAQLGEHCTGNARRTAQIANALGFILADHNRDLARADRLISTALKAEPDNPAILDSLGWLEYRRGMSQAALPLLERAFRLDQDGDIGAHWGEVLWAVGEKTKAREAWSRALIVDPDNALVKAAQAARRCSRQLPIPERAPRSEHHGWCAIGGVAVLLATRCFAAVRRAQRCRARQPSRAMPWPQRLRGAAGHRSSISRAGWAANAAARASRRAALAQQDDHGEHRSDRHRWDSARPTSSRRPDPAA